MPSSVSRCSALVAAAGAGDADMIGLLRDEVARKRQVPITPNARRRIHWTMVSGDTSASNVDRLGCAAVRRSGPRDRYRAACAPSPTGSSRSAAGLAGVRRAALLLQRRRNFLETRLGAAFVDQAARCAADADAADHLVTGLEQHGAGKQQDSRYAGQRGSGRVGGELRYQFALQILLEDRPERDDGIGLATARVQRVRRGTFVF